MTETQNKLYNYIQDYIQSYRRKPSKQEMVSFLNTSEYKLNKNLRELEKMGLLKLKIKKKRSRRKQTIDPASHPASHPASRPASHPASHPARTNKDFVFVGLRIVMFTVSVLCIVLSVQFSTRWFLDWLLPVFAFMFSITLILFSVGSFEIMFTSWKNKKIFIGFVYFVLFLVSFGINSWSTIETLYNSKSEKIEMQAEKNKTHETEKLFFEMIEKEIARYENEYKTYKAEYDRLQKEMQGMENTDQAYWSKFWERKETEKRMAEAKNKLEKAITEKKEFLGNKKTGVTRETEIRKETLSMMLHNNLLEGIHPDMIEFIIHLLAAVFIDIMAPTALAITLFLKK